MSSVAERLAALLLQGGGSPSDPTGSGLEMVDEVALQELESADEPPEVWAVDGGQALVADARCLQVCVTRTAIVRYRAGVCDVEEEGDLRAWLLGDSTGSVRILAGIADDAAVDPSVLREAGEWDAALDCVRRAAAGALVLIDGDLVSDRRLPGRVSAVTKEARERGVAVVGVTKQSGLARGGTPLVSWLESEAERTVGSRRRWWATVGRTGDRTVDVTVAKLDPDARYAFRVDLPGAADPAVTLSSLAAVCDDAAFPGYPYPLAVADRLAGCPSWVRQDSWSELAGELERLGVPVDVAERVFEDRHRLMERA